MINDERLRTWMAEYLMEFGSEPVVITDLRKNEWYQANARKNPGEKVEWWSDHRDLRIGGRPVFFHWGTPSPNLDKGTYELTRAGLDFIKGDTDDTA